MLELDTDIKKTEKHCEVVEELMQYPFNVSQVGFSLLVRCIEKQLDIVAQPASYANTIFKDVAKEFNMSVPCLERCMRDTMVTANVNCVNDPNVVYPNYLIKSALNETKTKNFVSAMGLYISTRYKRRLLERYSKNCW